MSEAAVESANGNGNSTWESDSVPVTELAARLGVPLPRLQRTLKKEPFASQTWKIERQTKTGTRTVTVVSISFIPVLEAAIQEGIGEQKQSKPLASNDERMRSMLDFVTRQADARIAEQSRTIEDLRRDKDELRSELERERLRSEALLSEVEQLKVLPAVADLKTDTGVVVVAPSVPASEKVERRRWWPWGKRV